MPAVTAASSNRTRLTVQSEGAYPAGYGVAPAVAVSNGIATNVNEVQITGETLKFDLKTTRSKILRQDRGVSDLIPTSAGVNGGIDLEHQYGNADQLKRAALQGDWVNYGSLAGTIGAPLTGFTVDATGLILTWAVAQANVADSPNRLSRGQFFKFNAPSGGAFTAAQRDYLNTSVFRVSPTVAPTTTVLTLDAITPFRSARYGAPTVANTAGLVISSSQAFNGNIMSSFQIEVSARDVNVHRLYRGMVVNTYELSFGSGDIVTEKYTFMGRTMEANLASRIGTNSPVPPSGLESANSVRGLLSTYLSTSAAADVLADMGPLATSPVYIKSFKLNVNNNLRAIEAAGIFGAAGISTGTFEVTGSIEMYFTSLDFYNRFLDSQAFALAVPILDPQGNGYVYVLPRIKISEGGFNAQGENQDLMLSLSFTALVGAESSLDKGVTMRIYRMGNT